MKLVNMILLSMLFSSQILTAETKEVKITTGPGNENNVWYSMDIGVVKTSPQNNWDLAFQTGLNGAIHLNCAKGYELYEVVNSDAFSWDTPLDTAGFRESDNFVATFNSEESWNIGAFNLGVDGFDGSGDFGWGDYDMGTHGITGKKLFLLITPDNQAKKIFIIRLQSSKYDFKYANLDGSDEVYSSVNKKERPNVSFIYFDFATNTILTEAREPHNTSWDLVFGKYQVKYDLGDGSYMPYTVSGVKQNQNVFVAQLDDVNVDTVEEPDSAAFDANITTIGHDWKKYLMQEGYYEISENRAYFVKSIEEIVYKLEFTDYSGSATGEFTFNQTRLGTSVNEDMGKIAFAVYPNVIESNGEISLVLSDDMPQQYQLSVHDMTGQTILSESIESDYLKQHKISGLDLASGVYFIHLTNKNGVLTQKFIVR